MTTTDCPTCGGDNRHPTTGEINCPRCIKESGTCPQLVWRVHREGDRWGIQAWDQPDPAHGQAEALNRVLPGVTHTAIHEPCGRTLLGGTTLCAPHGRLQ
jgi:hypothetical protein